MIALLAILASCSTTNHLNSKDPVAISAQQFFQLYSKRDDFEAFASMYAEEAELQDLVFGDHLIGKAAVVAFLDWRKDALKMLHPQALVVTKQTIDGKTVVTRGYFNEFLYQGQKLGPWRFVIWQEFNAEGKIVEQFDWINYTPKEQFVGGKNMNKLIAPED